MVEVLMVAEIMQPLRLEAEAQDTMVAAAQVLQAQHQTMVAPVVVAQVILAQQHQPQTQ
jgi:hypothetical protein